jgi:hypothetical protein
VLKWPQINAIFIFNTVTSLLNRPELAMNNVMRRRGIYFRFTVFIVSCFVIINSSHAEAWVVDDGVSEITPVYVMTHTQGQSYTFVRADFWNWETKKSVKLQTNGSISVNGIELKAESGQRGSITYVGNIPISEGIFTFKLTRSAQKIMEHIFETPPLNISEFPKSYRPFDSLRVPVDYKPTVGTTVYNMQIHFPQRNFDLTGNIKGTHIEFSPIIKVPLPSGTFEAAIYRQQRTPLRDISDATKTGWAVASNRKLFLIKVEN